MVMKNGNLRIIIAFILGFIISFITIPYIEVIKFETRDIFSLSIVLGMLSAAIFKKN